MQPYANHGTTCPIYWRRDVTMGEQPEGAAVWSGQLDVPQVGDRVRFTNARLPEGVVAGYFTQGGYLGILCEVPNAQAPAGAVDIVGAFGTELR